MASVNVSHLLGTLQEDPENDEALAQLSAVAGDEAAPLDDEQVRMLQTARRGHKARFEFRAAAVLMGVEARVVLDADPDRAALIFRELGRVHQDELLDDEQALAAYARALELRPGDAEVSSAIEQLERVAETWEQIASGFVEEAPRTSDVERRTSLLVNAATLFWKYREGGAEQEVDALFQEAIEASGADPWPVRLFERTLRARAEWDKLATVLIDAAGVAADASSRAAFFTRAARIYRLQLDDPGQAGTCYELALETQPGLREALGFLASQFMETESWNDLVELYENALKSSDKLEDEAGVLLQIAMVHWRFRGAPNDAEPYFARLRSVDPAHPGMLDFYREHHVDDSQWVAVLSAAQRAANSEAQKQEISVELAKVAQGEEGSADRAIEAWKSVLRSEPNNAEARLSLKALYQRTGKWNALVEVLKAELEALGDGDNQARLGVLRELLPVYRDRLELDVMVINTHNAILQLAPGDADSLQALAVAYESTGRWNDLIKVLTQQADAAEDPNQKVVLYMRVASYWIDRFANYNQATGPLEKVVEVEPDNRAALAQLKEIYTKKRAWQNLYEVLNRESELVSDPSARLQLKRELAELAGRRLHRHADAIALWKQILEEEPNASEALDQLERLAEREKDWATLAEVLERRVGEADDDRGRLKVLQKLGVIYADRLEDATAATGAWRRILDFDPQNGRALRTLRETFVRAQDWDGLESLYAQADDWEGLVDVLGNAADKSSDDSVRVELSFRAAEVYEKKLGKAARAFRAYERVLSADPGNERAARALIPLYEQADKWNRLPPLYEILIEASPDADAKLELLDTVRELAVERLSDESSAYGFAARAFQLAPTNEDVRATLHASATKAGKHAEQLALFLARLEQEAVEGEERAWLRRSAAQLADESLEQPDVAVTQLRALLDEHPEEVDAVSHLARLYRAADRFDELRALLLERVERGNDVAGRVALLAELAQLEEEALDNPESAGERYRAILELDATHRGALAALDRLLIVAQDWSGAAEIMRRRKENAETDDERIDLTLRLGEVLATALNQPAAALDEFGAVVEVRPESGRAIAGLELVAGLDPELEAPAALLLESAYEATGAWVKLGEVLKKRLDATTDPDERRRLRLRYADLASGKTGDALAAYRALEGAFLAEPTSSELQERLVAAAEEASQHEALAAAFSSVLEGEQLEAAGAAELASKIAQIYDVVLGRPEEAERFHLRVLSADPLDERAFMSLKELYTNGERWSELQDIYRDRIAETVDGETKLDLLMQVCFLFEELIDDPEAAIRAYRDVLELDPEHAASRRALERLYERTEHWEGLVELLEHERDRANPDEQLGLTQRLGVLHERKLSRPDRAVDFYEQVLEIEPNHRGSRDALERLLHNEEQRARVAAILEPIYQERADWPELVGVLEVQLESVEDLGTKVGLIMRVADLQENRLHDQAEAFGSIAAAFALDPADTMVREELSRLSGMRNAEPDRARVLENALESLDDDPVLQSDLLLELAVLWDDRVGDVDQAEEAYQRLLTVDPDNHDTVLQASRALERIHLGKGDHAALAEDLRRQVKLEHDVEVQGQLLVRLADLLEEVLVDTDGAIVAHRERLELDPGDMQAMQALQRLYEAAENWQSLIEILRLRDEASIEESEQREAARRIGEIYEECLGDRENAIIAYNDLLDRFGQDESTLEALSRLYAESERWSDLLDVAEMVCELVPEAPRRAAVRFQMGEILREHTDDVSRAVEMYAEALDLIPDHDSALAALSEVMRADGRPKSLPPPPPDADGEAAPPPPNPEYELDVRIDAARVLAPRFEVAGDYSSLIEALTVLSQADDPDERYRSLRRAAEVADIGLDDSQRSFSLLGQALESGLAEDDLVAMLRDLARLAESAECWADYADLLERLAPDILDAELSAQAQVAAAETARDRLSQPDRARKIFEAVLENQPDHLEALEALETLTAEAEDHAALLAVLVRKTELTEDAEERVELLLRRAELNEKELEDIQQAIDCYEQALDMGQPNEAYVGLERLYRKSERWPELASQYERMLDEGIGDAVALRFRLGVVQLEQLDDAWSALDHFRDALEMDVGHEPTIGALERLMEVDEHRATAAGLLEPVFLQQMNWAKVTACLEARIAAEDDLDEQKAHLMRLGQIHEDYLEDLEGALESYARLFRVDPRDRGPWETLARLGRVLERYDRLAEIYASALAEISMDDEDTAQLAFLTGQLHDQRTGDLAQAAEFYGRALAFEPTNHEAFIALEDVQKRREAWADLLGLYREQANSADDEADRVALIRKCAALLEGPLDEKERAVEAHRDILMVDPEDPNATAALDGLLVELERWTDLSDHYRHQIEHAADDEDANDLKLKLGQTLQSRLDDTVGAIDLYEEITESDPQHGDAVAALEALVKDAEHQLRIIQILEPIYLATDQWRKRIAIYEAQVRLEQDAFERVRILGEVAQLHEERSGDLQLAFHAWSRAMAAEPDNDDVRGQVDRIAAELEAWDALVAAYEEALRGTSDPMVGAGLLKVVARVHDEHLGDPRAAIATYERLIELDPEDGEPLDSLENLHAMVGDWRGMVAVLKLKVERSYDPEERGELHRRAGSVLDELLNDQPSAITAYRAALDEDEADFEALESLDRLYEATEAHADLAEILQRRLETEEDPGERVEIAMRLGGVNEEHLRRPDDAIEAYQRVVDEDPSRSDAVEALGRLFESERRWADLLDNLRQRAAVAENDADRVACLARVGEVLEKEMDDVSDALAAYEEVLEIEPRHEATLEALLRVAGMEDFRVRASEVLEPLLRTQERWDELATVLEGKVAASYDPEEKRAELRRLADVHEQGRNDPEAAFEAYKAALAEDAGDVTTADDIERLAESMDKWEAAANVFAAQASSALDPDASRALYNRLAVIAEEKLGDDARAVEAHTRALDQGAGDEEEVLEALDRLYTKMSAWEELGEILERRVESGADPAQRSELLVRLGTLKQTRFQDAQAAFRAFADVLESDPSEERAINAMESLLEDDELAADAIEVLEPVYEQIGDQGRIAGLYDARIRLADTDADRVRFLQDQAALYEEELGDVASALAALRRAFGLAPDDLDTLDGIERLAPTVDDGWSVLEGLVEAALEEKGEELDRMTVRDLNLRAAGWYEERLGNAEKAEARYRAALEADREAEEAHERLVTLLRADGREADLVASLRTWAEASFDEEANKERLREAAELAETVLEDRETAVACYEAILSADGSDTEALDELIRLAEAAERHERVAELLEQRIDAEMEPEERLALRKSLAGTLVTLERTDAAIDAWRGALDEDPTDLECIDALEGLYEGQERWSDLEELIQRRLDVAETPGERIVARVRLARLSESAFGRRDEAIEQLVDILGDDPENDEALAELERLYTVAERWEDLFELLDRKADIARSAGDLEAELALLIQLGSLSVERLSDSVRAIGMYERVLDQQPEHVAALEALLALYRDAEDWAMAIDVLEKLADAREGDAAIATVLEVAELAANELADPQRAEAALRRAYDLDGGSGESRDRLKAHYEQHDMAAELADMLALDEEEAEEPAEKVVILKRIADLYSGPLGDPGAAATFLERASELDPEDRDVLLPLCDLYVAAGRQDDAIPVLEQIIASYGTRRNKEVAVYHHRLGLAKQSMGDLDGAMKSFDAAFKVDLTNVIVLRDLGRLCLDREDYDRAQKTFRALLLQKLRPEHGIAKADVYYYLGLISHKSGDERKAISMFERAIAEDKEHEDAAAMLAELKG